MTKTVTSVDVFDVEKRRVPSKHYVYMIRVQWSDKSSFVIYRRYSRFFDLQTQLLDKFPIEAGAVDPDQRTIPFLPPKKFFGRSQVHTVASERLGKLDEYCKDLVKMPPHISHCDEVLEFFEVETEDLDPPKEQPNGRRFSLGLLGSKNKEKKADKISGPTRSDQYVAVADYAPQDKGEIHLVAGMTLEVTEKSESGWWFVIAEDQQGWVPSTYLQAANGSKNNTASICLADGQEEKHICIEKYAAANEDEISLEKGVLVDVVQKNEDGWWWVRYQEKEGYAPATYLKKSSDPHARNIVDKSRHSGVQIIGTIADVSSLMADKASCSPRNSGVFSASKMRSSAVSVATVNGQDDDFDDDDQAEYSTPDEAAMKRSSFAQVKHKQLSMERGGSLKPPPRQNSVIASRPLPPPPSAKPTTYVTVEDFEDTVGDGISFSAGETVTVLEKAATGWWFVQRGNDEGWVPESFLEPSGGQNGSTQAADDHDDDDDEFDDDEEEEEQVKPPASALTSALNARLKGRTKDGGGEGKGDGSSDRKSHAPFKLPAKPAGGAKPPPLPPSKPTNQDDVKSEKPKETPSGVASALKSRFESGKAPSTPLKPSEPPSLPKKPSDKPSLPVKGGEKPTPPLPPAGKPSPPSLPKKPADKPTADRSDVESGGVNVSGLASALKARFESQGDSSGSDGGGGDKPTKPTLKPTSPKPGRPSLPSKPASSDSGDSSGNRPALPGKPAFGGSVKPPTGQKPPLTGTKSSPFANAQTSPPKLPTGPPKLPSKPQTATKPSDANNNGDNRPSGNRVSSMAAAFAQTNLNPADTSAGSGAKPSLPSKKLNLPQFGAQKPAGAGGGNRASEVNIPNKPKVGSLVSELGSKLQFGAGIPSMASQPASDSDSVGRLNKSPEPSPVSKSGPWSAAQNPPGPSRVSTGGGGIRPAVPAPPPPQPKSSGLEYQVVADFTAQGEGEIDLRDGDVVEVLDQQDSDWWRVRTPDGVEGFAPATYLEAASEWDD